MPGRGARARAPGRWLVNQQEAGVRLKNENFPERGRSGVNFSVAFPNIVFYLGKVTLSAVIVQGWVLAG